MRIKLYLTKKTHFISVFFCTFSWIDIFKEYVEIFAQNASKD